VGLASADTLQRLTERIIEQHPACGHAAALLRVSCDEPDAIARIAEIVSPSDDRFAERMERLRASAFGQRFRDITDSASQLGCRPVLAATVATTTIEALDGETPHLDRFTFWRHAIATGVLALVGAGLDRAHEDEAFAAGFFSSIGRLMLDRYAAPTFGDALALARTSGVPVEEAILQRFDFPESEVAAALVMRWHLPVWVADAIAFPVRPAQVGAQAHTLAGLVFRARLVARARGFGAEGEGMQAPPDGLRWLTDPLLIAFDRLGGNAWLEAVVAGVLATALPGDGGLDGGLDGGA
jgi:HD-like signal output (HDOD) protein